MFDYIEYTAPCPSCGKELNSFQSKDGACCLETLQPWQVRTFYTTCDGCNSWVQFENEFAKIDFGQQAIELISRTNEFLEAGEPVDDELSQKIKEMVEKYKGLEGTFSVRHYKLNKTSE